METTNKTKTKKIFSILLNVFLFFLLVFSLFFAFYKFTIFDTHVSGGSMIPTFNADGSKDRIIASRIAGYTYGDIVIVKTFEDGTNNEIFIIKRLIALSGDSLDMTFIDGYLTLYVNGEEVIENQYEEKIKYEEEPLSYRRFVELKSNWGYEKNENGIVIPVGYVFVMGDNRLSSNDSTKHGPYEEEDVIAKVLTIIPENSIPFFEYIKYLI